MPMGSGAGAVPRDNSEPYQTISGDITWGEGGSLYSQLDLYTVITFAVLTLYIRLFLTIDDEIFLFNCKIFVTVVRIVLLVLVKRVGIIFF